jgi:hypothetical protein
MRFRTWMLFLSSLCAAAFADTPLDFSGEWVSSGDAGEPGDKPAAPHSHPGAHAMSGRGGCGMGGGGHGRHAQDAASGASATAADAPVDPRLHAHTLIIRQSEVVFDIAADGRRTVYRFDNRDNDGTAYGGSVTLTWSAPEMVIETHPDAGGSVEEHYTLSSDAQQLTLVTRMQRSDGTLREVRRVFVRNGTAPVNGIPMLP